jgi:lipoprotein-anchoring transpeptidase ErfK/SrfK
MALPSQTERTAEMSRPVMTRTGGQGGPPNKIVLGVVTLVLAAGAIYGIMRLLPSGSTGPSNAEAKVTPAKPTLPPPKSIAPPPPTTPADNPVVLSQGKPGGGDFGSLLNKPTDRPAPVNVLNPNGAPPPPVTVTPGATTPLPATASGASVRSFIEAGDRAFSSNKLVEARVSYSHALLSPEIARSDAEVIRAKVTTINDDLLFSSKVVAGDPLVESYSVASGDSLDRIKKKRDLAVDWRFLARVNKITNPTGLKIGQKLKLVRGPFSVIVHKNDYRLDLFAGSPDEQENWQYIRSFKVGLGEGGNTPVGTFMIKSKMVNPAWTNPKTGQHFDANDPANPVGEYWLGWEGIGDSKIYTGFGLHGTIDPSSIGQAKSMGCVRMLPDDIAEMYELLIEQASLVKIVEGDQVPGPTPVPPPEGRSLDLTK